MTDARDPQPQPPLAPSAPGTPDTPTTVLPSPEVPPATEPTRAVPLPPSGPTTSVFAPEQDPEPQPEPEDTGRSAREERQQQRVRSFVEWVAVIVGALVVALVVKTFLFQAFYIPSASMEPTLEKGDRVLVNKLSYDLHDVNRGDVVVFELPEGEVGPDGIQDLIKRVIGLPGDVIETRDGVVYINDRRLEEPYLADGTLTGDPNAGNNPAITRQTVPEGTVFVMGDNRANSHDSRFADRGPIPIDTIVGRAFVLVWPLSEIDSL